MIRTTFTNVYIVLFSNHRSGHAAPLLHSTPQGGVHPGAGSGVRRGSASDTSGGILKHPSKTASSSSSTGRGAGQDLIDFDTDKPIVQTGGGVAGGSEGKPTPSSSSSAVLTPPSKALTSHLRYIENQYVGFLEIIFFVERSDPINSTFSFSSVSVSSTEESSSAGESGISAPPVMVSTPTTTTASLPGAPPTPTKTPSGSTASAVRLASVQAGAEVEVVATSPQSKQAGLANNTILFYFSFFALLVCFWNYRETRSQVSMPRKYIFSISEHIFCKKNVIGKMKKE